MRLATALVLLLLPLAGCLGYPEGAARTGDYVAVQVTVTDLGTGEVLVQDQILSWQVGVGPTGLGPLLDEAANGLPINGTFSFGIADDDQLQPTDSLRVPTQLEPANRSFEVPLSYWRSRVPLAPAVGVEWPATPPLPGFYSSLPSYPTVATAVNNTTIVLQFNVTDTTTPVGSTGLSVRAVADGDTLRRTLHAQPGARFTVRTAQGEPSNLGMPDGAYVVGAVAADAITLRFNPEVDGPVLQRDVHVEGKVLAVSHRAQEPVDGNFGVRDSPVLGGRAAAPSTDGHSMH